MIFTLRFSPAYTSRRLSSQKPKGYSSLSTPINIQLPLHNITFYPFVNGLFPVFVPKTENRPPKGPVSHVTDTGIAVLCTDPHS